MITNFTAFTTKKDFTRTQHNISIIVPVRWKILAMFRLRLSASGSVAIKKNDLLDKSQTHEKTLEAPSPPLNTGARPTAARGSKDTQ